MTQLQSDQPQGNPEVNESPEVLTPGNREPQGIRNSEKKSGHDTDPESQAGGQKKDNEGGEDQEGQILEVPNQDNRPRNIPTENQMNA